MWYHFFRLVGGAFVVLLVTAALFRIVFAFI